MYSLGSTSPISLLPVSSLTLLEATIGCSSIDVYLDVLLIPPVIGVNEGIGVFFFLGLVFLVLTDIGNVAEAPPTEPPRAIEPPVTRLLFLVATEPPEPMLITEPTRTEPPPAEPLHPPMDSPLTDP